MVRRVVGRPLALRVSASSRPFVDTYSVRPLHASPSVDSEKPDAKPVGRKAPAETLTIDPASCAT